MIEQRRSKTNCIHVFRVSIDREYRSFVKQRLPSACKNSNNKTLDDYFHVLSAVRGSTIVRV